MALNRADASYWVARLTCDVVEAEKEVKVLRQKLKKAKEEKDILGPSPRPPLQEKETG